MDDIRQEFTYYVKSGRGGKRNARILRNFVNAFPTLLKALNLREVLRVPSPPLAVDHQLPEDQKPPATFVFSSKANHYPPLQCKPYPWKTLGQKTLMPV